METSISGEKQQMEGDHNNGEKSKAKVEITMKVAQVHLVVATLIMTVTFTAGFTLPGGFDSDAGPNKGMAILIRRTAFRAFVVSDAIAFVCSTGAIFFYYSMAIMMEDDPTQKVFKVIHKLYTVATYMQLLAMSAVVIAFITGMYATLAHSVGLAVTVCFIGCIAFPMYFWAICQTIKA